MTIEEKIEALRKEQTEVLKKFFRAGIECCEKAPYPTCLLLILPIQKIVDLQISKIQRRVDELVLEQKASEKNNG